MAANADTRYTNDPTRNASSGQKDTRTTHDPASAQAGGGGAGAVMRPWQAGGSVVWGG